MSQLGVVLAGGASRRFGSPKAAAEVGGVPLLRRVANAVAAAGLRAGLVVAQAEQAEASGLPFRLDTLPGAGPLGAIHAALRWAEEDGGSGAVCVACDLPFVASGLLRELARQGVLSDAPAVLPASPGPWGWEPLCAFYSVRALPRIEAVAAGGVYRLGTLVQALGAEVIPPERVRRWGDPARLFLNVNSPHDRSRAERIAAGQR